MSTGTGTAAVLARGPAPAWTWWREVSGSVADLGVLVPIAVAMVVVNGLSATAVLLPAGLAYLMVAVVYRVPVAVQPLKAFGAAAIAAGAGAEVIAAGALLMGALFLLLGTGDLLDRVARLFPVPVVRGVQLAVGLTFVLIAVRLLRDPAGFVHQPTTTWAVALAVVLAVAMLWRPRALVLAVVVGALVAAVVLAGTGGVVGAAGADGSATAATPALLGPTPLALPDLDLAAFATAAVLLVLPQAPLTFTNSCLAPPDAARRYFGADGVRVTASRLARTLGATNLAVGAVGGMPLCHGAGGMSAHHAAGGRTARTPAVIGGALVVAALAFGNGLTGVLSAFPVPVLAALLVTAAVAHVRLLADLQGRWAWGVAVGVGVLGVATNLAWAVLGGLLVSAGAAVVRGRKQEVPTA